MDSKKMFWPLLFILAGVAILFNVIFNFHISISKLIFAVVLIYIGYSILSGRKNEKTAAVFSEKKINSDKTRNYSYVFGSGDIDLTDIYLNGEDLKVKADVVFGTGRIRLKRSIPAVVRIESFFASVNYMGENTVLGEKTFKTPSYVEGEPCLYLSVSTVFGSVYIDMFD